MIDIGVIVLGIVLLMLINLFGKIAEKCEESKILDEEIEEWMEKWSGSKKKK